MDLSEIVTKIAELRQQGGSPDEGVAEYLAAALKAAGMRLQIQPFHYSDHALALVSAAVFILSLVVVISIFKRAHRVAFVAAIVIGLILLMELRFDIHVVSWPVLKKSENIIVQFPVQDVARTIVVGTHYGYEEDMPVAPTRFMATVSAFLLPMTLVVTVLGLWQLAMYFRKFDFEDAHTIMLIMGTVCTLYYALWFGVSGSAPVLSPIKVAPSYNSGSIAVIAGLAQDLSKKSPRLENTWVIIALFGRGGAGDNGVRALAKSLSGKDIDFIGLEEIGKGGRFGYLIPDDDMATSYASRELVRVLNQAAVGVADYQPEMVTTAMTDSKAFAEYGYPSLSITTFSPAMSQAGSSPESGGIDRNQVQVSLQWVEKVLSVIDKPGFVEKKP